MESETVHLLALVCSVAVTLYFLVVENSEMLEDKDTNE